MRGSILIEGEDIVTAEGQERLELLIKIGVMYQEGALFGSMNLLENVRLPLEEYTDLPDDAIDTIALMKLQLVELRSAAYKLPDEISGGMRKRAAIARAMALDPRILFLDEPSAGTRSHHVGRIGSADCEPRQEPQDHVRRRNA